MAHTLPLLLKVHCPPRGPLFILGRPGDEKAPGLEGPGAFFASEILASGALHAQLQAQFQAQLQTQQFLHRLAAADEAGADWLDTTITRPSTSARSVVQLL